MIYLFLDAAVTQPKKSEVNRIKVSSNLYWGQTLKKYGEKMKEIFEKTINKIAKKINLLVDLEIIYINDKYNSLYIKQTMDKFVLYVDIDEIYKTNLEIEPLIIHELYHLKQFLNNFPMIVSNETNFFIIQKIITDLYVDLELIEDDFYDYAKALYLHRINNLRKIIHHDLNREDSYRIGLLYFESNYIFKNEYINIEEYLIKIKDETMKDKIKTIYKIFVENYQKKIVLYEKLINLEEKNKKILLYDNKIII